MRARVRARVRATQVRAGVRARVRARVGARFGDRVTHARSAFSVPKKRMSGPRRRSSARHSSTP